LAIPAKDPQKAAIARESGKVNAERIPMILDAAIGPNASELFKKKVITVADQTAADFKTLGENGPDVVSPGEASCFSTLEASCALSESTISDALELLRTVPLECCFRRPMRTRELWGTLGAQADAVEMHKTVTQRTCLKRFIFD